MKYPLDYANIEDWDMMEAIWAHGFESLRIDPKEHPILLADSPFSLPAQREKAVEIMFESQRVPALYLARAPVLAAFSTGRHTAVVVDAGHSATRVVPVIEGHIITKSLHASEVGGFLLTQAVGAAVNAAVGAGRGGVSGDVRPRYAFTKSAAGGGSKATAMEVDSGADGAAKDSYVTGGGRWNVTLNRGALSHATASYHATAVEAVIDDIKRCLCVVNEVGYGVMGKPVASATYELPDGSSVSLDEPREQLSDM